MQSIIDKQKSFLENIYKLLIKNYDKDFKITQDEIAINFTDQYYFSEYELKLLAQGKFDIVSKFIINEM
jgi:hypothetical protein